jgi:hypothetical protein
MLEKNKKYYVFSNFHKTDNVILIDLPNKTIYNIYFRISPKYHNLSPQKVPP